MALGAVNAGVGLPEPLPIHSIMTNEIRSKLPDDGRSFSSNLQLLFGEFELATQWGRPSLLLAVCKSTLTQDKAQKQLEKMLSGLGQPVVRIDVGRENDDVPRQILQHGNADKTFFFISSLDRGGGEDGKGAYRTLNMQREMFVDHQVKAVFWMTPGEASNLPKHAPDFWAFRHRVVEFASPRATSRKSLPAGVLVWRLRHTADSASAVRESILAQEDLLRRLPEGIESSSQRIELYEVLGQLYWRLGETAQALDSLSRGLALAKNDQLKQSRAWLLNGVAIISFERRDHQKAFEIYTEVLADRPDDGFIWANLAITLSALGKNREAMFRSEQAVRLTPLDARLWNAAGHLHIATGKMDQAVAHFRKAIELAPDTPDHKISLAVSFALLGLLDDALRELESAVAGNGRHTGYLEACRQAILGNGDASLELLRGTLKSGELSSIQLMRDPNLAALLDPARIAALS